ncbi:hypothetical protein FZW96_14195 [Bacillus sp. BGMRC 2118]|nr:hypothetical protein FZW96_14195 [Bacillus sp. BGMRC 2118]
MNVNKLVLPMILSSFVITGCSSTEEQGKDHTAHNHDHERVPKLEYVMGSNDWSVITSLNENPEILEAYQFAVDHPEVLNYMPCYCGCHEEDGHTSNTNCFVDSVEGDIAKLDLMGFS